jgi:hypothetical protein
VVGWTCYLHLVARLVETLHGLCENAGDMVAERGVERLESGLGLVVGLVGLVVGLVGLVVGLVERGVELVVGLVQGGDVIVVFAVTKTFFTNKSFRKAFIFSAFGFFCLWMETS